MRHTLPFVLLLSACARNFATVDEACHDNVPGEGQIDEPDAIDFVGRINCYRRVVRLRRGNLDPKVQEGTENHVDYMSQNAVFDTYADFTLETQGLPGFTGESIYERMDDVGYIAPAAEGWGIWELGWVDDDLTPEERVDYHASDPFWRQVFLQPDWSDAGYAEVTDASGRKTAYAAIFYDYPNVEREWSPVVYPKDGQLDVPPRYTSDTPSDSIFPLGEVGFPITVTFGNDATSAFSAGASNPYSVGFDSASLSGPDGDIELKVILPPGESPGDVLRYTLVAVPLTPLRPSADYTFTAVVTWGGDEEAEVTSTFTTAATDDLRYTNPQVARVAPTLRHRSWSRDDAVDPGAGP